MTETDNVQVVQQIYAAFGSGDIPAVLALLDEAVVWRLAGPADVVPYAGPRRGRQEVGQCFQQLGESVEFQSFEPREYLVQGDRVVVLGTERGRVRATGKGFENDWAMVFIVREGLVTSLRTYEDTAAVVEAFRG
jgi:uncharacterized protein